MTLFFQLLVRHPPTPPEEVNITGLPPRAPQCRSHDSHCCPFELRSHGCRPCYPMPICCCRASLQAVRRRRCSTRSSLHRPSPFFSVAGMPPSPLYHWELPIHPTMPSPKLTGRPPLHLPSSAIARVRVPTVMPSCLNSAPCRSPCNPMPLLLPVFPPDQLCRRATVAVPYPSSNYHQTSNQPSNQQQLANACNRPRFQHGMNIRLRCSERNVVAKTSKQTRHTRIILPL